MTAPPLPVRPDFILRLRCPVCSSPLQAVGPAGAVLDGSLGCACGRTYEVRGGIPDLFVRWDESPVEEGAGPLPDYRLTPSRLAHLAAVTGADRLAPSSDVDPRSFPLVRYRKAFTALRACLWLLLPFIFFSPRTRFLGWIACLGFAADFLAVQLLRRSQQRWEVAHLLRMAREGKSHEKDVRDPLQRPETVDPEELAPDQFSDIWDAVRSVDLRGLDVLHVGCGGRKNADLNDVYIRKGAKLVGLDIHEPSLREFRELHSSDAVLAEALRIPFADGSFEFVNATDIIEHLPDPFRFLLEVRRVLKPSGGLLLVTPNRCRARRSLDFLNPLVFLQFWLGDRWGRLLPPPERLARHEDYVFYHTSFTSSDLEGLFRAAGFEIRESRIKAYRGVMKRARRFAERVPGLRILNDSLFVAARKRGENG